MWKRLAAVGQVRNPELAGGGQVGGSPVFTETIQAWPDSDHNWKKGQHIPAKGTKKLGPSGGRGVQDPGHTSSRASGGPVVLQGGGGAAEPHSNELQ